VKKGTIKTIDRSKIVLDKTKENLVHIKELDRNGSENATNYAEGNITNTAGNISNKGVHKFNQLGRKSVIETKNNIVKSKAMLDKHKTKLAEKGLEKTSKSAIKLKSGNIIKPNKNLIKTKPAKGLENAVKMQKETVKKSKQIAKVLKESARRTAQATKRAVSGVINMAKAVIAATKTLIAFLIAGGWIAVLVIIIICLIGMVLSSTFGIFFSSEDTGTNSKPMNVVIQEINKEFASKVTEIQKSNTYDEYTVTGKRAEWKDVLAIYTVRASGNNMDVVTLNDEKVELLKSIFWEMNTISSNTTTRTEEKATGDSTTGIKTETVTANILNIQIESKTALEIADKYNFTTEQRQQLNELLSDEYAELWNAVIYGSHVESGDIVTVALSQVSNVGGQPYWSWYGFTSRVEWCACFVSWCADQCGYIENGIIPKFAGVDQGVAFFKVCDEWQDRSYIPKAGDIIFFDWEHDGIGSHVGIVEYVADGKIHTIEGNSDDACRQREYELGSVDIMGYGVPMY